MPLFAKPWPLLFLCKSSDIWPDSCQFGERTAQRDCTLAPRSILHDDFYLPQQWSQLQHKRDGSSLRLLQRPLNK
ncbi:hypothetical protein TIFTF001_006106 [Ficus carica]|uniref:Uncharacterized protein n=1 Tax=Ficus carica TaxID=3494 RepID=A0AA88CVN8_FICCA|nr:hypothetical protein TIFTF001_006106 [Ficus carica]